MASDLELLEAWRDGDADAGEQLIGRHFDSICRFFRYKLGDDVEDLIQRTFLDCVEARDRVHGVSFRGYLFAIARNRLYDHLRAGQRAPERVNPGSQSLADFGTSPSRKVARSQEEQLLLEAMQRIPLDQQIALELAYWEELSGKEIAAVLGIPANTVRSRLARGRDALRREIELAAASPALAASTMRSFEAKLSDLL